ncbi:MAG: copper amine oxidase N-terminal domain-containing protein [Clostridia bacterium]|nr:copper amine oxidase N-terminal domain-containing protein [Clostridia bacterium]
MKSKLLSVIIASILLLSAFGVYADGEMVVVSSKPITVTYNGTQIAFPDANPLIQNNKTLVPVRAIMEYADLDVDFDPEIRKVTAKNENLLIEMHIDDVNATVTAGKEVKKVVLEEPARIIKDRTYVPIRFIGESLGTKVNWNPNAREVVIIDTAKWKEKIAEKSSMLAKFIDMPLYNQTPVAESMAGEIQLAYQLKDVPVDAGKTIDVNMDMNMSFSGAGVFDGTNRGTYTSIETDPSFLKKYLQDMGDEKLAALAHIQNIDLEVIVDEELNIYLKSKAIVELLRDGGERELAEAIGDRYVKMTVKDLLGDFISEEGFKLCATAESLWDLVEKLVASDDMLYTQSVEMIDAFIELCSTKYGDKMFKVTKGVGGAEIWTYVLDEKTYAEMMADLTKTMNEAMGIVTDEEDMALQQKALEPKDMSMKMTMTVKNNMPVKAEVAFSMSTEEESMYGGTEITKIKMNVGSSTRAFDARKDKKVAIPQNVVNLASLDRLLPETTLIVE